MDVMDWDEPLACGNDHPLEAGNVLVAWTPCDCARATGGPKGHSYVKCLTCEWEWREGGCDQVRDGFPINPPHRGTGNPGDPGYPRRQQD